MIQCKKLINIYRKYEGEYNQLSERLSEINSVRSKVKDLLEQELLSDKITRVSNDSFTLTRTYREGSIDWKRMLADKVISEEVLSSYKRAGTATTIMNTFTPEDIELSETLYCLWIAE